MCSTILPNPSQGEAGCWPWLCTKPHFHTVQGKVFLTHPLPRPQIMYLRPSATQHLTVLVGHVPKVPFAPGHLAQRPDQGEAKTL